MAKYKDVTIGQMEACINRMDGTENFLRYIGGKGNVLFESILRCVRVVTIPAQPAVKTSKEYFKEAGVTWMMSYTFETQLSGLEVSATEEVELRVSRLSKDWYSPVIPELGDKAEITISQFLAFLAENRGGAGRPFLSCIRGTDGKLWSAEAFWDLKDKGWNINVTSLTMPFRWESGKFVVSRN